METKNNSFTNISIPFLRSCSQERFHDRNISKTIVFIFDPNIQQDEASGPKSDFTNEQKTKNEVTDQQSSLFLSISRGDFYLFLCIYFYFTSVSYPCVTRVHVKDQLAIKAF